MRTVAASTFVAMGLGAALVVPAHAAPTSEVAANIETSHNSSDCSAVGDTAAVANSGALKPGKWIARNTSLSTTVTSGTDPEDTGVIEASVKAKARRTLKAGLLRSLESKGTLSASESLPASTTCDPDAVVDVNSLTHGVFDQPTWVVFTTVNKSASPAVFVNIAYSSALIHPNYSVVVAPNSRHRATVLLRSGLPVDVVQSVETALDGFGRSSVKVKYEMSAVFLGLGEAVAKAQGKATPYLGLPSFAGCSTRSVTVPFTGKAAGLKSATFTVNGKKKASVKGPFGKGLAVHLSGIAPSKKAVVKASVVTKGGKKLTASRTYMPCA